MLVKLFMDLTHTVKSKKGGIHLPFQAGCWIFLKLHMHRLIIQHGKYTLSS